MSLFTSPCVRTSSAGGEPLQIPDMLGVVLSSSKYGVRQARGKYGMGAKMALIWSKKSTGLPIQVGVRVSSAWYPETSLSRTTNIQASACVCVRVFVIIHRSFGS